MAGRFMQMLALAAGVATAVLAVDDSDVITLPGAPKVDFPLRGGYITVDPKHGRELYYYFAGHAKNDAKAPLTLWLNGGPGCSSLGGGFTELGPFFPNKDGTLRFNEYGWNQLSHMIFLESPAGVGFSFSNNSTDYIVGDHRTSTDIVAFLVGFIKLHPEFKENPIWITGESYGGHYVPNAADAILEWNKRAPAGERLNLAGFAVGNAWTDAPTDNQGAVDYWYYHALVSGPTHQRILDTCDFTKVGPLKGAAPSDECDRACDQADKEMGNINIYDIYADVCLQGANMDGIQLLKSLKEAGAMGHMPNLHGNRPDDYEPCIENYLDAYLNRHDVKIAMRARPDIKWHQCGGVEYSRKDLLTSMFPVYRRLLADGSINMLVFSGDIDAIVPYTGSRRWVDKLNLTTVEPWAPWFGPDEQVAGYLTKYEGLSFTTVRGAGHMVPSRAPQRAKAMMESVYDGSIFA